VGLLKHLLFWPVTGPTFLARFSLEKVSETVRGELTNDEVIKEDLLALQMRLELGEIDDAEYLVEEAALMQRLRDVRQWREEYGMGMAGGPVRVAGSAREEPAGGGSQPANERAAEATAADSPDGAGTGGVASPEGASVDVNFDWEV
jgi:hypothetical protein